MTDVPEARPASTVVLLRDSAGELETLLLKRNKALVFAGGMWVFPGGSLDQADFDAAGGDVERAARIAAAREAREEAGVAPAPRDMVQLSHWTTPVGEPRRFSTWIFAAPLHSDDHVVIDGGEIHDSRWLSVREAIARHEAGELAMLPPTYITLRNLSRYASVDEAVNSERETPVPEVFPVMIVEEDCMTVLFRGDAGYDDKSLSATGARHRAELRGATWDYVREDVPPAYPSLIPE
ncbi:MAG: NUDIX hydrolase [Halioglobus sp.]|nr:NUDIX hydrolase [Halioglobus sp.]